jgi:DNA-binding transcriptional LysR family regulator
MDLRKLRYFIAAAEEANFRRAAVRLHVTQPTLSEQIQELEKDLGVRLFDRLPRGVRLSKAGALFLGEARRLLAELERAVEQTRRVGRGELDLLRIGFSEIEAQQRLVAEALHRFRRDFPQVALDLRLLNSAEQQQALRSDALDAGFCHSAGEGDDSLASLLLQTDRYVLAISKYDPLAKQARITSEDLASRTLLWAYRRVESRGESQQSDPTESYFASIGIPASRIIRTGGDLAAINLASVGMGIGLVLSSQRLGYSEGVVYRELPGAPRLMNAVLAWRKDNRSQPLAEFVRLVSGLLRAKPRETRRTR